VCTQRSSTVILCYMFHKYFFASKCLRKHYRDNFQNKRLAIQRRRPHEIPVRLLWAWWICAAPVQRLSPVWDQTLRVISVTIPPPEDIDSWLLVVQKTYTQACCAHVLGMLLALLKNGWRNKCLTHDNNVHTCVHCLALGRNLAFIWPCIVTNFL